MNDSIEATAKDPVTGKRYFQPTVFAAPKYPASPVIPPRTLDPDSMPTESRVEGGHVKSGGNNSHHIKGSVPSSKTVPSTSTSTSSYFSTTISTSIKTNASVSLSLSMSKNIGRSVSTDGSTGVSSRVRRTPEEVSRALTNTQSSLSHRQKSSQLQVELQPQPQPHHQHEVLMCSTYSLCVCKCVCAIELMYVHI